MPKMIPKRIDPNTPSPGEIEFFTRISLEENISDWTILHSLNIAPTHHQTRIMGEIDFLVIIPKLGMIAIEIKAHREIRIEDGIWFLGRSDQSGSRNPFVQLKDTMFSLQKYISNNNVLLKEIPIFPLVIFTHCEVTLESVEVDRTSYASSKEFRSGQLSELLKKKISLAREELLKKNSAQWLRYNPDRPDEKDISNLIKLLRPNLELSHQVANHSETIEKELLKFTAEQFDALDSLADHSCVLFSGPAGTGKTFIAIESAIRAAKEGSKVLFICMNKLLNEHLKKQLNGYANITVSTLHALLKSYDPKTSPSIEDQDNYWNNELPQLAYSNIINKSEDGSYDLLIIDEAQDIIGNNLWLDCLDLLLDKGLTYGKWHIFGDFVYQSIYSKNVSESELIDNLRKRNPSFINYKLYKNCRNTESSSRRSLNLLAMDSPYKSYLRSQSSILDSQYYMYSNDSEQLKKLNEILKTCLKEGFNYSDIVILSKVAESKSLAHKNKELLNAKVYTLDPDGLSYTSIHKFKGLEGPVIILTDFDEIESEEAQKMMFTGATRATDSVHFLFHKKIEKTFQTRFKKALNK
ncbi:NERD domain-containing protein [Acinetobacter radioresistens]|uniref:nuclease-related domain-containing DEAD/DEAH box helicase n=1 Tax=Acinetobacter radioresistens TaxID=40216 RepID=UPI003B28C5A0